MTNTTTATVANAAVVAAYVAADKATKATMRAAYPGAIDAATRNRDIELALQLMADRDACKAASTATKPPVDHVAAMVTRIATLYGAADILLNDPLFNATVDAAEFDMAAFVELTESIRVAGNWADYANNDSINKLTAERVSRSGKRFNVAEFVAAVLAAHDGNFMTVAQLRGGAVDGDAPSGGAISAYLNRVGAGETDPTNDVHVNTVNGVLGAGVAAA